MNDALARTLMMFGLLFILYSVFNIYNMNEGNVEGWWGRSSQSSRNANAIRRTNARARYNTSLSIHAINKSYRNSAEIGRNKWAIGENTRRIGALNARSMNNSNLIQRNSNNLYWLGRQVNSIQGQMSRTSNEMNRTRWSIERTRRTADRAAASANESYSKIMDTAKYVDTRVGPEIPDFKASNW